MTEKIVQFVNPKVQLPYELDDMCDYCPCADACAAATDLNGDEALNAWATECCRVAALRGGFPACGLTPVVKP